MPILGSDLLEKIIEDIKNLNDVSKHKATYTNLHFQIEILFYMSMKYS